MKRINYYFFLVLTIILVGSLTLVTAETFGFGRTKEIPINYSLIPTVNSSDYWDGLASPADIDHNLLNNLAWSVAGHTIDENIDMNGYTFTELENVIINDGSYLGSWGTNLLIANPLVPVGALDLGTSDYPWEDLYLSGNVYGRGTGSWFNQTLLISGDSPVSSNSNADLWLRAEVNHDACINLTEGTVAGISICYDGTGSGIFEIRNYRNGYVYMTIDSRDSGNITFYNDTNFVSVNIETLNVTGNVTADNFFGNWNGSSDYIPYSNANFNVDLNGKNLTNVSAMVIKNNNLNLDSIYSTNNPIFKIESLDSMMELASEDDFTWGSGIALTDFNSMGGLNNKWVIVRQTEGAGDNRLSYTYGNSVNFWDNTERFRMSSAGTFYTNGLGATGTEITMVSDVDMYGKILYLNKDLGYYFYFDDLFEYRTLLNSPLTTQGLQTTAYDITTTTGKHKAGEIIIDGGFPSLSNVIGLDSNGAITKSLYIGGFDEGGADVFYNLQYLRLYGKIVTIGDGTTSNSEVLINGKLDVKGNITGNQIYGGMFYHNHTATTFTFTAQDTWYPLYFTTATDLNGFSSEGIAVEGVSNLTAQVAGVYQVTYMAIGSGQNNHVYLTTILVNGVEKPECGNHHKMAAGGDVLTQSGNCIITLAIGDDVGLATQDMGGTGDGEYYGGNVNLVRIGD